MGLLKNGIAYLGRRRVGRRRIPLRTTRRLLNVVPPVLVPVPLCMPARRHRRGRSVWGRGTLGRRGATVVGALMRRGAALGVSTTLRVSAALAGIASGLVCRVIFLVSYANYANSRSHKCRFLSCAAYLALVHSPYSRSSYRRRRRGLRPCRPTF